MPAIWKDYGDQRSNPVREIRGMAALHTKMINKKPKYPEFFLTSTEVRTTLIPRKCKVIEPLWSRERQTFFFRIHIEPPIRITFRDEVDQIVIAPRHQGVDLFNKKQLTPFVYVCFIVNKGIINSGQVTAGDLKFFLIGELYNSIKKKKKAIADLKSRI